MNAKERLIEQVSQVFDQKVVLHEMVMEYGPDGHAEGALDAVMSLDLSDSIKLCELFKIHSPTKNVRFVGKIYFEGFQG